MIERMKWYALVADDQGATEKPFYGTYISAVFNMDRGTCLVMKGEDGRVHEVELNQFRP